MSDGPGNGSSDSDVKEHFFRRFKQEETSLQEQMARLEETALPPAERASITDQCLASISQLSNEVKHASAYLPAYDQRMYSTLNRRSSLSTKNCKKHAILLPQSASLHLKRPLRRNLPATLVMDLPKMPQCKGGRLGQLPRTSLIIIVADPNETSTTSMLGPLQG